MLWQCKVDLLLLFQSLLAHWINNTIIFYSIILMFNFDPQNNHQLLNKWGVSARDWWICLIRCHLERCIDIPVSQGVGVVSGEAWWLPGWMAGQLPFGQLLFNLSTSQSSTRVITSYTQRWEGQMKWDCTTISHYLIQISAIIPV